MNNIEEYTGFTVYNVYFLRKQISKLVPTTSNEEYILECSIIELMSIF